MMLLTQNSKMKKTSKGNLVVYNFGIPAFKSETGLITCPSAKLCVAGCYARSGTYGFSQVAKAYENKLKATLADNFVDVMTAEIMLLKVKNSGKILFIRIHDSGDFYSQEYLLKWVTIMLKHPDIRFYAYTKQISMLKKFKSIGLIPDNFTTIFSFGGKEDHLIDTNRDRHAKVFETARKIERGYINATNNDLYALSDASLKVGLAYHGVKKYSNTRWSEVTV
jgi:hypothetical protein